MKAIQHSARIKMFLWIGVAYAGLWMFGDLIMNRDTFLVRVWNNIWLVTYLAIVNYFVFEKIGRFFQLQWKKLMVLPFILLLLFLTYSIFFYGWRGLGISLHLYFPLVNPKSIEEGITMFMPYSLMSVIFFGVVRHFYDYRKLQADTQQLRIEKQEAELNFLKSQTNPHFLFNTLNNIYSLSREKSDLAPESILRLSKILRFMLYETSGKFIAIEQELKTISDYVALEQLRYDESLRVNINHNIEDMRQAIPPLLLIPLVENAFKHGASETRSGPFVDIHLSVNNRMLTFEVKNSTETQTSDEPVQENIGLSNLRRQLQLLYTDYSLQLNQKDRTFIATLKINLASYV